MTKPFDLIDISVHRTLQAIDLYEKDGRVKLLLGSFWMPSQSFLGITRLVLFLIGNGGGFTHNIGRNKCQSRKNEIRDKMNSHIPTSCEKRFAHPFKQFDLE